jgi:predicted O-methyltransferase YrrM
MHFHEFYQKFGSAFRTKHLYPVPTGTLARLGWLARFVLAAGTHRRPGKRVYSIPQGTALPPEYIRLDPWEGEYLFLLAQRARTGILEVGRFHGGSTFLMACANSDVPVHSIDIAPKDDDRLRSFFRQYGVGINVNLIVGDSQNGTFPGLSGIDLLFIDGDHSYHGCHNDLMNHYHRVVPGGHVVLHDCYFGSEVQSAVVDFLRNHDVQMMRSPYIIPSHWHTSYGSLCHFQKPWSQVRAA